MRIFLFFIVMGIVCHANAQTSKAKFHSINQVGLLNGSKGTASHLQSVNGFQYKNFFGGIGVGLDYYRYRSIPLFAEARKYFGNAKNKLFVYADGGVHFVWEKIENFSGASVKQYPQFYSNAGIGYQLAMDKNVGLTFNIGYSYKRVKYKQDIYNFCPLVGLCYENSTTYIYDFNRLVIQIGLVF